MTCVPEVSFDKSLSPREDFLYKNLEVMYLHP